MWKTSKSNLRYPILFRLFAVQVFVLVLGGALVAAAYQTVVHMNAGRELEAFRRHAFSQVLAHEENLIAWDKLDMLEARDSLLEDLRNELSLVSLQMYPADQPESWGLSDRRLIISSDLSKQMGRVLIAEVNPSTLPAARREVPVLPLLSIGFLGFLILLYSNYFLYRQIFKPLHLVRKTFEQMADRGQIEWSKIEAMGEIQELLNVIRQLYVESQQRDRAKAIAQVVRGVAHDVRSPLAALEIMLRTADELLPENKELLEQAARRIREIVSSLETKALQAPSALVQVALIEIKMRMQNLIAEKKARYSSLKNFDFQLVWDLAAFSDLDLVLISTIDFQRTLSNVIDNAIESLKEAGGEVSVRVSSPGPHKFIEIQVMDTGRGIESDVLPLLGSEGFTHHKPGGSGLGLFQAMSSAKSWGAVLTIHSQVEKGTSVKLQLPLLRTVSSLLFEIKARGFSQILIADDDPQFRSAWIAILGSSLGSSNISIESFSKLKDLERSLNRIKAVGSKTLFLIDKDFESAKETGLQFSRRALSEYAVVLVTGATLDRSLLEAALTARLPILTKDQIRNFMDNPAKNI